MRVASSIANGIHRLQISHVDTSNLPRFPLSHRCQCANHREASMFNVGPQSITITRKDQREARYRGLGFNEETDWERGGGGRVSVRNRGCDVMEECSGPFAHRKRDVSGRARQQDEQTEKVYAFDGSRYPDWLPTLAQVEISTGIRISNYRSHLKTSGWPCRESPFVVSARKQGVRLQVEKHLAEANSSRDDKERAAAPREIQRALARAWTRILHVEESGGIVRIRFSKGRDAVLTCVLSNVRLDNYQPVPNVGTIPIAWEVNGWFIRAYFACSEKEVSLKYWFQC